MQNLITHTPGGQPRWRYLSLFILVSILLVSMGVGSTLPTTAQAQENGGSVGFDQGIDPAQWYQDHEIENSWVPGYLDLATGDPTLASEHGVYAWPFALDSIGWSMQSYQDYGGSPYFHHGMDMMKVNGTQVFNWSGGQVINIENYNPGWDLYWEVAILDPDGYIWQYHHIQVETIPQYIWDKWYEWQADPINGGFIEPGNYIGSIIYWPVWSFGKQFNHIHLNILAAGGVYVNGFEFHDPLPDTDGPEIQAVGLLQNGQILPGSTVEGDYSLYVRARDLILDDVYYLPPWEITFAVDCGPVETTWRFDTLPGGWDDTAYLDDFYVVPPTCGDYDCRNYVIDLGFIPASQFQFPSSGGNHTVAVTVRDYAGNTASQSFTYNVIGSPNQAPVAIPQSLTTPENIPLDILLSASDADHDPLTFDLVSLPEHGILGGLAPSLVYNPTANYFGSDSFVFTASDCHETSAPATIDIDVTSVNSPPQPDPQTVTTQEEMPVDILLTGSDPEGEPLAFTIVTPPMQGALGGIAPNLVYTPTLNFNGTDSFTFVVNDGLVDSDPAEVTIEVAPVNDAPLANQQQVIAHSPVPVAITLTGMDVDGDSLNFSVSVPPSHGVLGGSAPNLFYTGTAGYIGLDEFSFVVSDGTLSSNPAQVSIIVFQAVFIPVISK